MYFWRRLNNCGYIMQNYQSFPVQEGHLGRRSFTLKIHCGDDPLSPSRFCSVSIPMENETALTRAPYHCQAELFEHRPVT